MGIKVIPIGGYNEVGMNMTYVEVDNEGVIFDMGFFLPKLVEMDDSHMNRRNLTSKGLQKFGVIPDDNVLSSFKGKVKAVIPSHGHLDHMGAVPFLADKYKCPIIATPLTMEIIKENMRDDKIKLHNKFITLNPGGKFRLTKNLVVEFIHVTHSIPHTVLVVLHTKYGAIVYGNDFKLDNDPVLWGPPNYKRMKKLGEEGVKLLIVDSLYSNTPGKTPTERIARNKVRDAMLNTYSEGHSIILTTFASQLVRIASAIEFSKKMDRKPVLLGRSMHKYVTAAERVGLVKFTNQAELVGYSRKVEGKLREIERNRDRYTIICTGNQAETGAILTRMSTGKLPFKFLKGDHVLFSCITIPVHPNIENRAELEKRLKNKGARLFLDLHSSGHCYAEDLRDVIKMLKPQHVIPCQGEHKRMHGMLELGEQEGYKKGKTFHLLNNKQKLEVR